MVHRSRNENRAFARAKRLKESGFAPARRTREVKPVRVDMIADGIADFLSDEVVGDYNIGEGYESEEDEAQTTDWYVARGREL